ncbi:unnamed protein product [Chironomus riparius]|uniref:Uncharacterized protein n=1 Tax=Chironomus riparius TaxID=315576 RepID=A0A9N9WXP0_9DIPT|nr:unnamed protein product [Chironomus riparius]
MILWNLFVFIVVFNFIICNIFCEDIENDFNELPEKDLNELPENNVSEEMVEEENSRNYVLDSVYDTLRQNYEMKLQQNVQKLNMISDIRNKRNTNDPMTNVNYQDYYKNHQLDFNRKNALTFPLGFKHTPKVIPIANPGPPLHRSDYYDEDYGYQFHKCQEKPAVQTFHISDQDHEHKQHPSISMVLLTGLKYLFGGFAILALPFIVLKAIFLPIKFFFFFKALALLKTFLMMTVFMRFLRYNRRFQNFPNRPNNRPNRPNFPLFPGRYKTKLQTIKDILNSQEMVDLDVDGEVDDDYRTEEEPLSKENASAPMYLNNPFNSSDISAEFLENLEKLIKLKGKKW